MENKVSKLQPSIASRYETVDNLTYGVARVMNYDGLYTFVDKNGLEFPNKYKKAYVFGYADKPEYGVTLVQLLNEKWVYINLKGQTISKEYEELSRFSKGIVRAKIDEDKWTFLNRNFEEFGGVYKKVSSFNLYDYAFVQFQDNKLAIINKEGKLSKYRYDAIYDMGKNRIDARMDGVAVVLDINENVIKFERDSLYYNNYPIITYKNHEQQLFDELSVNPHFVKNISCFCFIDPEKLNKITKIIEEHIEKAQTSLTPMVPFWNNEKYVEFVKNTFEETKQQKIKEAKQKKLIAYYDAKIEDTTREYKEKINELKLAKASDRELIN